MVEDRKIYRRTVKILILSLGDLIHPEVPVIVNTNNLLQLTTVLPDPLKIAEWPVSTIRTLFEHQQVCQVCCLK